MEIIIRKYPTQLIKPLDGKLLDWSSRYKYGEVIKLWKQNHTFSQLLFAIALIESFSSDRIQSDNFFFDLTKLYCNEQGTLSFVVYQ
jgi:hypothetical protein